MYGNFMLNSFISSVSLFQLNELAVCAILYVDSGPVATYSMSHISLCNFTTSSLIIEVKTEENGEIMSNHKHGRLLEVVAGRSE